MRVNALWRSCQAERPTKTVSLRQQGEKAPAIWRKRPVQGKYRPEFIGNQDLLCLKCPFVCLKKCPGECPGRKNRYHLVPRRGCRRSAPRTNPSCNDNGTPGRTRTTRRSDSFGCAKASAPRRCASTRRAGSFSRRAVEVETPYSAAFTTSSCTWRGMAS